MSWLKSVTAATVVVHTRDGRSIRGILVGAYRHEVVLAHASLLHTGSEDQLEDACGVAFVRRGRRVTLDGTGSSRSSLRDGAVEPCRTLASSTRCGECVFKI